MLIFSKFKKPFIFIFAIFVVISVASSSQAQSSGSTDALLQQIYQVLQKIDANVFTLSKNFATYMTNWTQPDTSVEPIKNLSAYTTAIGNNLLVQRGLDKDGKGVEIQTQLLNELFSGVTSKEIPSVNNLTYTTLLKLPYSLPGTQQPANTDPAFGFVKNAAGLSIIHYPPWTYKFQNKNVTDQSIYAANYNTLMAIETFDAYVLSGYYVDYLNKTPPDQLELFKQANNKTWTDQLNSQPIGYVLRQMLLYESQSFVLMSQLLQTSKQMVAAQAMTNTLLILNNQSNEKKLFQKAAGVPITP
ncbi:MAG: hypothetical protein A3F11_04720 [Gammaproteobacteria bacterium RIFCSPHIGHO2_12_FULL_37_14]|nr:MAG: hypothetical protein A3F11_04720 [Gammaproteobacteria bacterium RIFCSPHIGHO2_12_FULL_37_14]